MFINRDWNLPENKDLEKNIVPLITNDCVIGNKEAIEVWHDGALIGWEIKPRYE